MERLFSEAAELAVEQALAAFDPAYTPRFSQIEEAARRLARQLSCRIRERMAREVVAQPATKAHGRPFSARAFLGDGLPWNWQIGKQHSRQFTPILDFIHVPAHLYAAARKDPA